MKVELECTYKDELRKLQEENERQTERDKEAIKLQIEQKFVEELRKVTAFTVVWPDYYNTI